MHLDLAAESLKRQSSLDALDEIINGFEKNLEKFDKKEEL